LAVLIFICAGISRAQSVDLVGVLFKLERMRDNATADIQRYEGEIYKCNATIGKCENIIRLARQRGNAEAEKIAGNALTKARQAKLKNEELRNSAVLGKKRADIAFTSVRNLLSKNPVSNGHIIRGVVTHYTGDVRIYGTNSSKVSLKDGLLKPGDEIWTGDGSAEIQMLGGRATTKIGPHSNLIMRGYTPQEKVAELIKGKVYIAVDKIDEYVKKMKEEIAQHKSDPTFKDKVVGKMLDKYEGVLDRYEKKVKSIRFNDDVKGMMGLLPMVIRTPCAVLADRGTKFLVFEDEKTGTELIVLEGVVDVKAIKGTESTSVNAGYRIRATKDGVISKPEKIDLKKLKRWWEK